MNDFLLNNVLQPLVENVLPGFNLLLFIMVIAIGYIVRSIKAFSNIAVTLKVFVSTLIITLLYIVFAKVAFSVWLSTYFIAFGFHASIIKLIERFFKVRKEKKIINKMWDLKTSDIVDKNIINRMEANNSDQNNPNNEINTGSGDEPNTGGDKGNEPNSFYRPNDR